MNETLNADCNVLVVSGESQEYPPSQLTRRMSQIALSVAGVLANECNPTMPIWRLRRASIEGSEGLMVQSSVLAQSTTGSRYRSKMST